MRRHSSSWNKFIGLFIVCVFLSSSSILFLGSEKGYTQNDWTFSRGTERKLLESDDEKASNWREDYHDIDRHNGNNRFCCFQVDESQTEETGTTVYECDWNGYVEDLAYISIPGIVLSVVCSLLCCSLAIGRRCSLCGGSQPSRGYCCVDEKQFHGYTKKNVCCLKIFVGLLLLIIIGITPLSFYGNSQMISGSESSGNDAVDAANEVNDLAQEIYQQSLLVPTLDQETQDAIQDTLNYTSEFVDDANTFKDNMDLVNFWRNLLLLITLSFLILFCLFALYSLIISAPRCMAWSNGCISSIIPFLWIILVLTTVAAVTTSDFCWELDYALESPANIQSSYIGYLMDCNDEDYPFADLEIELATSQKELVDEICQSWSKYCSSFSEVNCNVNGFDCNDDLQESSQIYSRTTITEDGETYTIHQCSLNCTDSDLQSASSDLDSLLIGLDALNEIIIEVAPYTTCTWIYQTLDEISNPTCVDAIIGGVYLSIGLILLIVLTFLLSPFGLMSTKRLNRAYWRESDDYSLVKL